MLKVVADEAARAELSAGLDEICHEGPRRMLAAALEAEVDAYVEGLADEVDEHGNRLVVRNGQRGHGRSRPARVASIFVLHAWMTDTSIRRRVTGWGSRARSCRRGVASPRR